jgi:hypothetical protein
MSQSNPNPEERARIVAAATKVFKPADPSPEEQLITRFEQHKKQVEQMMLTVKNAEGGYFRNPKAAIELSAKQYAEQLHSWSKDEILYLLCAFLGNATYENLR